MSVFPRFLCNEESLSHSSAATIFLLCTLGCTNATKRRSTMHYTILLLTKNSDFYPNEQTYLKKLTLMLCISTSERMIAHVFAWLKMMKNG